MRKLLALSKEISLLNAVKKLVAEVKQLRELPKWEEVPLADLEEFWPTLKLDKKPFIRHASVARQKTPRAVAGRMRAENMTRARILE